MNTLLKLKTLGKHKIVAVLFTVVLLLLIVVPIVLATNSLSNNKQQTTPTSIGDTVAPINTNKAVDPVSQEQASTAIDVPPSKPSGSGDYHITKTCKDIAIPYQIQYYDDSYLYVGETKVDRAGVNGLKKDCTEVYDGKDWGKYYGRTSNEVYTEVYPTDAYVDRGTKPKPTTTPPTNPTYTYEQALQLATSQCSPIAQASGTDSSAYQSCLSSALGSYGY